MSSLSFICHSSQDADIANKIVGKLEEAGIPCWIAPRNIPQGLNYAAQIVQGLKNSGLVIFIFTKSSNQSEAVVNEIEKALALKLPVIPFKLVNDEYSDSLEYYLRTKQSSNAWNKSFDAAVSELIVHIKSIHGSPAGHHPVMAEQPSHVIPSSSIPGVPAKKPATGKYALIILALLVLVFLAYQFMQPKDNKPPETSLPLATDSEQVNNKPPATPATNNPTTGHQIFVTPSISKAPAGGEADVILKVVSDQNNAPLADAAVLVECNAGSFKNGTSTDTGKTDANGNYHTKWRAPTSDHDTWSGKYIITRKDYDTKNGTFNFPVKK